ncbi:hypothetical protein V8D89_007584 [Ganoderma adspersum]
MIPRPSTLLVLLSALNYYYVSGAVVTLLVPAAAPNQALSGKYLGTDTEGHTSWSVGPGSPSGSFTDTDFPGVTVVAGATDAQAQGTLATVLGGVSATISASEGCTFSAPASGGAVAANCLASGQVVGTFGPGGVPTTSFTQTEFTTLATLVPIQVPDSGSGAIPSGTSTSPTSSSPTSTSTTNGALKGGVSWGIAGPASLFILIASLM